MYVYVDVYVDVYVYIYIPLTPAESLGGWFFFLLKWLWDLWGTMLQLSFRDCGQGLGTIKP